MAARVASCDSALVEKDNTRRRAATVVPLAFVVFGVLAVAGVDFFEFPLDAEVAPATVVVVLAAYALGLVCAAAAVCLARRFGTWREALLVAVVMVVGFAAVVPTDLGRCYPWMYFQAHRKAFVAVGELTDYVAGSDGQRHTVRLPPHVSLVHGTMEVLIDDDGAVVLELLMEETSGIGYGYVHAPSARRGDTVDADLDLQLVMLLGDGWWWAESGLE